MLAAANEAAQWIHDRWSVRPRAGIILGTGLGNLAGHIDAEAVFPYGQIPHFRPTTAIGHRGQLICGTLASVPVVTMEGRFHAYEGYSLAETTLPVRVLKRLGVRLLIVSNASGGMNPYFQPGQIMVIDDHINLMPGNPLVGTHDSALGARYPDMRSPYDPRLIEAALRIARRRNIVMHRGVYVAVLGPNYETRAEYRFLRRIGGDVVGMSTVPEVIVAAQEGLGVLALSTITNVCLPDALDPTAAEDVVAAAEPAEASMREIVREILVQESAWQ